MADELQDTLQKAVSGLDYPSESDTPFDVFRWPAQGPASAREQVAAHVHAGRKIEQVSVGDFFAALNDSDDAERFRALRKILVSRLAGLGVFRVGAGEVNVDIYLVGKTPQGDWAGVHTESVET